MEYFSPVSFSDAFASQLGLVLVCMLNVNRMTNRSSAGVVWGFLAGNIAVAKQVYHLESRDRENFMETTIALRSLQSQNQDRQSEATLVGNAMRLAFPENPFHDAATEARIEEAKSELSISDLDTAIISEGLVPSSQALPRYVKLLATRLRGVKIAMFTLNDEPVIVQSIPNLDAMESGADLQEFMRTIRDASGLPEISGLARTLGYCLTPCTFVVQDVAFPNTFTLRDLALELGSQDLKLDWCFFKPLAASLTASLSTLHRHGMLHRHVSAASIVLTGRETCTLPPVSFYHALPEARKKCWGSSGFWEVAPEAKSSPENYSEASEVWAVCVVAWEMLVGPFNFQVTPFAMPATVPKAIVSSIIDGLSPDPDGRPTMEELYRSFSQEEPASRDSTVASAEVFERVTAMVEDDEDDVDLLSPSPPKVTFDQ